MWPPIRAQLRNLWISELFVRVIVFGDAGFREYLEAKFSIDSESLNRKTHSHFAAALAKMNSPVILDLGTGTGAMIRRIVESELVPEIVLYGIESNRDLLESGRTALSQLLKQKGYAVKSGDQIISATDGRRKVEIHLVAGDIFDSKLQSTLAPIQFTGATSHAFMDIVPLDLTLELVRRMLPKGGVFYSTINYDGTTEMLPFFEDREFEERLFSAYNQSMDERLPVGVAPASVDSAAPGGNHRRAGGSRTGSALYDQVLQHGFSITGFGTSDWSIFPWNGSYTDQEEIFLNSLILTIYEEGLRHPELDRYTLSAWYAQRSQAIEERSLSLITHQTDILAARR